MILFAVGKSKVAAELLSVEGIGLIFTLSSAIGIIGTISNFGLATLATRDISLLFKKDKNLFLKEISLYNILSFTTGIIGLLLIIIFHRQIGFFSFGNSEYNLYIILLCVLPLLSQYNTSQFSVLQASQNFTYLTKSNILSSFFVFISAITLYYFLRQDGIPLVIIITAIFPVLFNTLFIKKLNYKRVKISYSLIYERFILLVKRGSFISLSYSLPNITIYLITIFLIKEEGLIASGLFACAYTIMSNFNNLLVSTLNPEFLSRISNQNNVVKISEHINNQIKLVINIISPLLILLIFSSSFLIILFYNNDFILSNNVLILLLLSAVFKSLLWVLNYIYIVMKNESFFFYIEMTLSLFIVLFVYTFYSTFDLETLGIAFLGSYFLVFLFSSLIIFIKYKITLSLNTVINIVPQILILTVLAFLKINYFEYDFTYLFLTFFITSGLISYFYFKKTLNY
jgi:O-antigen/teichoic acid export membrane protein